MIANYLNHRILYVIEIKQKRTDGLAIETIMPVLFKLYHMADMVALPISHGISLDPYG